MMGGLFGSSRQERVLKLLDQEHSVILNGPLADLAALVERREATMEEVLSGDGDPTEPFLAAVKSKAERNSRLLLASLAGVRAALEQIGRIRAAGARLRTYGADGQSIELRPTEISRDTRA